MDNSYIQDMLQCMCIECLRKFACMQAEIAEKLEKKSEICSSLFGVSDCPCLVKFLEQHANGYSYQNTLLK